MAKIGYALSSEEHGGSDLVRNARRCEEVGFRFAMISDHFHPWVNRQGQSPFVWSVLGGIAGATDELRIGTAVTCPIIRLHPAIIAHAAATVAAMMPGRFWLGLGTGEWLNEHVLGGVWPSPALRLEMLEEAVEIIRHLWRGGTVSLRGDHYEIDRARLYTLPPEPPPILIGAAASKSLELAGRIGDGLICVRSGTEPVERFRAAGGEGKPTFTGVKVCWARSEKEARRTAREWWPNAALRGQLGTEVATPELFESILELATEDQVTEAIVCGPDAGRHVEAIRKLVNDGYENVYVHQVGPDQDGFFRFYETEVLPELRDPEPHRSAERPEAGA